MTFLSQWVTHIVQKHENPSIKGKIRQFFINKGFSRGTYYNILNGDTDIKPVHYDVFLEAFRKYEPEITLSDIQNPVPLPEPKTV